MKKYVILVALLFSGVIFAQETKPVLEPFGKKVKATYFYDNGQVQQEGFFENGKLVGTWISYNEAGEKTSFGEYENGVKTGKWFFWKGSNLSEVDYANNKVEKVKNWREEALATSN
jgi:antitoxin component YwqK of YwqJK toxin-antitoxin module